MLNFPKGMYDKFLMCMRAQLLWQYTQEDCSFMAASSPLTIVCRLLLAMVQVLSGCVAQDVQSAVR